MNNVDYSFLFHHVDIDNCGEHDMYNAFLFADDGLVGEYAAWQNANPGCVPVGICPENVHDAGVGFVYYAMVYEDEEGRRFFVHVPAYWIDEARVVDQGPEAREDARWKRLYGHTKSSLFKGRKHRHAQEGEKP